jgi:acetyl-CoA carboxylase biotin carboxyl carrier protein
VAGEPNNRASKPAKTQPGESKPADEGIGMARKKSAIDPDLIRELAKLLEETGLTEIEFERGGERVRVARRLRRAAASPPSGAGHDLPTVKLATDGGPIDPASHPGLVTSPMVGTAFVGPKPGDRPFVEIGSRVTAGETLLIIEAMKTMNQIPAPRTGTVVQILIEDGQPVEFGEPLMIVE